VETKLNLISEKARKDMKCKFNNLIHLLNVENLKECFYMLKKNRAVGIDNVSFEEYEKNLDENLHGLVQRMKMWQYLPQPVRRAYIPKSNGKLRPLGIPCLEDKIVQMGVARILEAIYEADFLDHSYGFRPNRSCHDALDRVYRIIMTKYVTQIIDADIKGFYDNVSQKWMLRCLEERISDKSLLRLIVRILKSGVMEEGKYQDTGKGVPQGGIISPILSNIYLHYILDLWMEKVVKRRRKGYVEIVRYADDFIICVQEKEEANYILEALKERLKKFGLELAEDKTRIIEFGRYEEGHAKSKGLKPQTFNFLGFTHYCTRSRKDKFLLGRKTDRKKFNMKMKEMNKWLKEIRNTVVIKVWWNILKSKLRGHFQYYGISGNIKEIQKFYSKSTRLIFKWINRRSQKKSMNWEQFNRYLKLYPLPRPKIYHTYVSLYSH
jgi:group II intron reverse transcriptase/maturase